MLHQQRYILIAFIIIILLLGGCALQRSIDPYGTMSRTVTATTPPETVVVTATATPAPSSIPTPLPPEPKVLTVCLVGEPDTLYLYGDSRLAATRHVMEALYDGPIDHPNYAYQPAILQKIPSVADGDALRRSVRVHAGDRVVDVAGAIVELTEGVQIRPTGCYTDGCAVEFAGEPLWVERMEATFVLRDDVTWADGTPLTAADSEFAFQVASDPTTPGRRYLTERTAYYRALPDQRVTWIGLPGFMDPTYFLNFFAPLPRHQLEDHSPTALLQADETRRYPLGWGPFVVEEWAPGDHITLSRNPNYFRAAEGLPYLDQVVFKFTSGAPEVLAGLLSGECDVGTRDAGFESFMPLLVQAEERGLLEIIAAPGNGWEHIDFGIAPLADYRRVDFFGDARVRQAIAQCIDRQAIVDEITYGRSVVPDSYLPPTHPLYAGDDLRHWDYDPAAGRALLDAVGWRDEDGNGVRDARGVEGVRADTPFEVTLLTSSDSPASQQVARIIKAQLADCGIHLDLETRSAWELFADGPEGPLFGRRFDMVETAWWFDAIPPCGHYLSSEIPDEERWHGDNPTGYSNPDYDAVCQMALQELHGMPGYDEYHRQAQVIFSEELPALPLFMWLKIAVARPGVLNFAMHPTAQSELWNIEMLDLMCR